MRIPLGKSDFVRSVAQTADVRLINRYFEQDPTDQQDGVDLLSRPCLRKWLTMAKSPVQQIYSQPGTFGEALFAAAGGDVYKIAQDETVTDIGTIGSTTGAVSMAATDTYLFIADGTGLWYYTEDDYAHGTLTITGAISSGQTVTIGSTVYKFATDLTPAADGSSGKPWLVAIGTNDAETLSNLYYAINDLGTAGAEYSLALTPNTDVSPVSVDDTTLKIRAQDNGTGGNSIATTETMANGSWGGTTLSGGGGTSFTQVAVPDDNGIVSVGVIASFTICVVAQGEGKNGRFYWIEPGENTIDPLNFATAERSPDPVWEVKVVGDQFWLPGPSTNEVWYPTGDSLAPFQRQQGRLFDQGIWAGTIVGVDDAVYCVGIDGTPYEVTDAPVPIGDQSIVERFREAINAARAA